MGARDELRATAPPIPRVSEIMSVDPAATAPDEPLVHAARRMCEWDVRHLPVIEGGRLVGMLSDRDVRSAVGDPTRPLSNDLLVEDVMSHAPRTVRRDAAVTELLPILLEDRVGAVPIVDEEGRLEGIASYVDVLRAAALAAWQRGGTDDRGS